MCHVCHAGWCVEGATSPSSLHIPSSKNAITPVYAIGVGHITIICSKGYIIDRNPTTSCCNGKHICLKKVVWWWLLISGVLEKVVR